MATPEPGQEPNNNVQAPDNTTQAKPNHLFRQAKRWILIVIGFSVLLVGLALIFLPGPAFLVIPLGLAILAGEMLWARRLLKKVKEKLSWGNDKKDQITSTNSISK